MKTVLAFGDSLTFGACPTGQGRHPKTSRWPDVVAAETGFEVLSEGLRGRTTAHDQMTSPANLNGAALLPSALHSHAPIDLLAIMLGTNDCYFGYGARQARDGLVRLIEIARHHPFRSCPQDPPKILLLAPPPMRACPAKDISLQMIAESTELTERISEVSKTYGTGFFDTAHVAQASDLDGVHLDADNTRAIGLAVAPVIAGILND